MQKAAAFLSILSFLVVDVSAKLRFICPLPHDTVCLETGRQLSSVEKSLWPKPQTVTVSRRNENVVENFHQASSYGVSFEYQSDSVREKVPFSTVSEYYCSRFHTVLKEYQSNLSSDFYFGIQITLANLGKCDYNASTDQDGFYNSTISVQDGTATVFSRTKAGFFYALESILQTLSADLSNVERVEILDYPKFEWRGIMVDTARHFIPANAILHLLSLSLSNKLNKLHMHLTDSTAFTLALNEEPDLSRKSTVSKFHRYSVKDIERIISSASKVGIDVIPEIDMPAHVHSWKWSKGVVLDCPGVLPLNPMDHDNEYKKNDLSVLDISKEGTYELLERILNETAAMFPSKYIHLGLDEVDYRCWNSYDHFVAWKKDRGFSDSDAVSYFAERVFSIVKRLGKIPIVWQDAYEILGSELPKGTVVQTWKCWQESNTYGMQSGYYYAEKAARQGYDVVQSSCLYLDWDSQWSDIYGHGPVESNQHTLGGEVALWTERIDFTNFDCRLWPRSSSIAETLWNRQPSNGISFKAIRDRLLLHAQRMYVMNGARLSTTSPNAKYNQRDMNDIQSACPLLKHQGVQNSLDQYMPFDDKNIVL